VQNGNVYSTPAPIVKSTDADDALPCAPLEIHSELPQFCRDFFPSKKEKEAEFPLQTYLQGQFVTQKKMALKSAHVIAQARDLRGELQDLSRRIDMVEAVVELACRCVDEITDINRCYAGRATAELGCSAGRTADAEHGERVRSPGPR
jgi:hypothetical protein